jgi:transposase
MALISEIGDFQRFPSAQQFSAFLGLVPGEHSSGTTQHRCAITKAGNAHLRRLLIESASTFVRGKVGQKSVALRKRQQGNPPAVIAYADRANERLKRKYIRLSRRCRPNVAKTAIARELACFVWGMMTGKID